jgi:Transposase, Mutator family
MSDTAKMGRNYEGPPGRRPLVDEELADQLLGRAQAEGAELLGPDGLLSQVTKVVLERALAEEMTGHLGYEKHDPAGRGSGNSRNGTTLKTVLTGVGAVDLAGAAGPAGSFEPRIVRKGQAGSVADLVAWRLGWLTALRDHAAGALSWRSCCRICRRCAWSVWPKLRARW